MAHVPYQHVCRNCEASVVSLDVLAPDSPCPSGDGRHRWVRLIPTIHFAVHEAGHAIVGARLSGPASIRRVRILGKGRFGVASTTFRWDPAALIELLAGGISVGLVGTLWDGAGADLARFRQELALWLISDLELDSFVDPGFAARIAPAIDAAVPIFESAAERIVNDSIPAIMAFAEILERELVLEGQPLADAFASIGIDPVDPALAGEALDPGLPRRLWNEAI